MADREAFDAYVRERWEPLLRTATLLTGDAAAAEDLVQESLVRAARHWHRVDPGAVDAYVRRILYTRSVDAWRWRRHQPDPVDRCRARARPAPTTRMPSPPASRSPTPCRRLTPRQRAVLVARFYEDRTEVDSRTGARLLGEHREVADPPRPGAAAGARARARLHVRPRGGPAMSPDRLGTALRDLVDDADRRSGAARRRPPVGRRPTASRPRGGRPAARDGVRGCARRPHPVAGRWSACIGPRRARR